MLPVLRVSGLNKSFVMHAQGGLALRVLAAAQEIAAHQPDAQVLIVAHGVALAVILCQAAGVPLAEVYQHIPDHARPVCIQQLPAAFRNL